jgi:type VI secretion system secreted protein Hcp
MAVDMFLRIDDIKGESEDDKHKDEIEVLSWKWAAKQTGTSGVGGGGGTGKVEIQDLIIQKRVDRASPTLYKLCCSGQHIPAADLTVRKAGGEALEYLKIRLEELLITSYDVSGEPKDDVIIEEIRINFSRAGLTYTPQDAKGVGGAAIVGGWDLKKNKTFEPG